MQITFNSILDNFQIFQQSASKVWNDSHYLRIISLVTGSVAATFTMRNLYIKIYRKYHKLPHGPIGVPFLGQSWDILHPKRLVQFATNYGALTSFIIGPYNAILINDPHLAKQLYSDPRTVDIPSTFNTDLGFGFLNGKPWSERRRIIYSNLMSTMKASYVETTTKTFIKSKVFPVFDANIKQNEPTNVKPLFRPIGFNIVLQACFGKTLSSLDDEYWLKYNKQATQNNKNAEIQSMIVVMLGNSKISQMIQKLLTGDDFMAAFDQLIDIIDAFTQSSDSGVEPNDGVKLFNDYVESYVNNKEGTKWTRRQLLSDMAMMFFAATDTTFSTLAFTLLIAAKYPTIQHEIHQEIVAAFGNCVDDIELRHQGFTKIPKLRALIHESLRMFPPAQVAGFRQIMEDGVTLTTKDKVYNIPKSTCICINVCGIGQNPKHWIDDYDPIHNEYHKNIDMNEPHLDFWMDDDGHFSKKKNSASFFAFHIGKRDCVGQALAMKELMIVLAMIFMRYKVIPASDGKTDFEIESMFGGIVMEPVIRNVRLQLRD